MSFIGGYIYANIYVVVSSLFTLIFHILVLRTLKDADIFILVDKIIKIVLGCIKMLMVFGFSGIGLVFIQLIIYILIILDAISILFGCIITVYFKKSEIENEKNDIEIIQKVENPHISILKQDTF